MPPTIEALAREALAQAPPAGVTSQASAVLPALLRDVGKTSLLSATGEQDAATLEWRADTWPREGAGTLAALAFVTRSTEVGSVGLGRAPHVFVVQRMAGTVVNVQARGAVTAPRASCINTQGNSEVELTIAPTSPELAKDRKALAVRATCVREAVGGTGSTTEVFIFDRQGSALVQVLTAVLDRIEFDRPSGKETTQEGTLVALPTETRGYRDLLIKTQRVERTALLEAADSQEKTQRRLLPGAEARYKWTGERYAEAGP